MDTRGAVDLSLEVSDIAMPNTQVLSYDDVERWADASGAGVPPWLWVRLQLTRLAAASVLEARLLHVKAARLGVFGLVPDPDQVTLQQLAPLQLIHKGTAGQAFEIAVADAVAAGHPEVTGLIRAGLRRLNLAADGPLSMVVLGLEKVPGDLHEEFWSNVRRVLPDDGRFRHGRQGRPASVDTVIGSLAEMTTTAMKRPRQERPGDAMSQSQYRDSVSQLGRADALVVCGSDLVAASLKINHLAARREAWRDVPLWITVGPQTTVEDLRRRDPSLRSPRISVELPAQGWFAVFRDALEAVDVALGHINRDVPSPHPDTLPIKFGWPAETMRVSDAVARTLWIHRRESIAEVAALLRRTDPGLREVVGGFDVSRDTVHLTSLDVDAIVAGWLTASDDGQLIAAQDHLFRKLHGAEHALVIA